MSVARRNKTPWRNGPVWLSNKRETIMKRTLLALIATTFVSFAVAPAFADDINLKTAKGIEKFWRDHGRESGNGR